MILGNIGGVEMKEQCESTTEPLDDGKCLVLTNDSKLVEEEEY
jgi:hypothetical protein